MSLDCSDPQNSAHCSGKFSTKYYPIIRHFHHGLSKAERYSKTSKFTKEDDYDEIYDEILEDIGDETTNVASGSM